MIEVTKHLVQCVYNPDDTLALSFYDVSCLSISAKIVLPISQSNYEGSFITLCIHTPEHNILAKAKTRSGRIDESDLAITMVHCYHFLLLVSWFANCMVP